MFLKNNLLLVGFAAFCLMIMSVLSYFIITKLPINNSGNEGAIVDSDSDPQEVDEAEEVATNPVNLDINLKSFYFNDPNQPTGNELNFEGEYTNEIPTLVQKSKDKAVLVYENGLVILLAYPTEGSPSYYENLNYNEVELSLTDGPIFKFEGSESILANWSDYLDLSNYTNSYVYTNNLNHNCSVSSNVFCSNNQLTISELQNIYLVCSGIDKAVLEKCDAEIQKIKLVN